MHVGLVVYGGLDATSGGYRYDRRLADGLRAAGDAVDVIGLPEAGYGRSLLHNLSPAIRRRLRGPHDVLVEDELCHPSLLRSDRGGATPVVSLVHHLRSAAAPPGRARRTARALERRYLAGVDAAVCVSEATARTVRDLRPLPTRVVHPGRDHVSPEITPDGIRDRSAREPFRIVFLGNLVPRKGLDVLLEALADLPTGWRLDVVGDDTAAPRYAARVQDLARELDLDAAVSFHGRLPADAVADRLGDGHVLAVPSRYEGFGLAYLEGMGYGLPPVAAATGGAPEFVDEGETGFLVPPEDPDAVADGIGTLMADRSRLAAMGTAARSRFLAHHTWGESTERARSFLEGITRSDDSAVADAARGEDP